MPYIRRAQENDYEAIWHIWMQDHIIQWMSFSKQTKEEFRSHYDHMNRTSEIYVLIDKIAGNERVVAVRRIKFGKGAYAHTAEFCSMGVDERYLRKSYGSMLYDEFQKIAEKRGIKRLQLTQSGGNNAAFALVEKKGFVEEARFPDWLARPMIEGEGGHHLIERYVYKFIDEELKTSAQKIPTLQFLPKYPQKISLPSSPTIQRKDNTFTCTYAGKPLFTVTFEPEPKKSVIPHIGFISVELHSTPEFPVSVAGFRQILSTLCNEPSLKKLELFTKNPEVANLCREAGFFARGERVAAYCDKDGYKNELGVEYSFFNIDDAIALVTSQTKGERRSSLVQALRQCSATIAALAANMSDLFTMRYLENFVYQMVRDELGKKDVFSLTEKPWQSLLEKIPQQLLVNLKQLENRLHSGAAQKFFEPQSAVHGSSSTEHNTESDLKPGGQ